MRWLVLALGVVTVALWWMLVDQWPNLPARVPLLHWRAERTSWLVDRSVVTWFGPPAVLTLVAWAIGPWLGQWILRRALTGGALPWRLWRQVRLLPVDSRRRVVQPLRLAVAFAACCVVILVGAWYAAVEELLQERTSSLAGKVAMLGAMLTGLGAGLTLTRVQARRELDAFVAAGGRLGDG